MRLRLTVQRNALPATNIVWSVPETNSTQGYTISRLLEDVNHIIPLEAEHWGLEHYVVEVGGFECLHFMPVTHALKEDDHVAIRPLMRAEVRARTLTGRDQITDGGLHLADGIPFGRPYLRQPNRPAVRIPPHKRRRLDHGEEEGGGEAEAEDGADVMGLLTANSEQDETAALVNGHRRPRSNTATPRQASKSVQFVQPETATRDDDSEEDDDDFVPEPGADDQASSAANSDDSNSDSSSDSDSDSDADSASDSDSDSDSGSDSDSDSDSDSGSDTSTDSEAEDSDASNPPDVLSSKHGPKALPSTTTTTTTTTIPSQKHSPFRRGMEETKLRNARNRLARRIRTKRLRRLKRSGTLPAHATLDHLREYEQENKSQPVEKPVHSPASSVLLGKRRRMEEDEAAEAGADDTTELGQRTKVMRARLGEFSNSTAPAAESMQPPEGGTVHLSVAEPMQPPAPIVEPETLPSQAPLNQEQPVQDRISARRIRPDTRAIARILAHQAATPAVRKAKTKPATEEPPEPEGASDPDFWKSRINLSAFECWDEDFELSTPPFPFQQHWDPASKLMRDKAAKKKQKKRKNGSQDAFPAEAEEEEEKIILNYDDAPVPENPDSVINAAIEDQLRQDVATAAQADLPPLPQDMSTLPDLACSDMKVGAVIVCKFFTVNPITVTPEISVYKTATVEQEGDSGPGAGMIQLKIAARDLARKEKKFDCNGHRIYSAADALLMKGDDEDDGLWEGQFGELLEPKLLKAA
ncbi:hypothetical protein BDW02DRAFT_557153 [Decorospora gaudefroyi]|uniref:DUF7357 domain-containing protein n=1 Tax=Decorospora gaudefroyi TaxID=184978 RepID=A0A6A5K2Q2_9PLEO|nr:hypothetical protein BDW02DRAFT_557153 [Decorospora gaudefroyi]